MIQSRALPTRSESSGRTSICNRAYDLSDDANLKDRMATLAEKLSEYYLAQATRYLNKPLASGVGLGWSYLNKALPYKASNLDSVRDEMTKAVICLPVPLKVVDSGGLPGSNIATR